MIYVYLVTSLNDDGSEKYPPLHDYNLQTDSIYETLCTNRIVTTMLDYEGRNVNAGRSNQVLNSKYSELQNNKLKGTTNLNL